MSVVILTLECYDLYWVAISVRENLHENHPAENRPGQLPRPAVVCLLLLRSFSHIHSGELQLGLLFKAFFARVAKAKLAGHISSPYSSPAVNKEKLTYI